MIEGITPPVRRASELQKSLRLDKNLSWSIFTAATARDLNMVASLVPGAKAMSRVFDAAHSRGVSVEAIRGARQAFDSFEATVARHAADRDLFEMMVTDVNSSGPDACAALEAKHRRAAFRVNGLLWGRQMRTCVGPVIIHPSAAPGLVDRVNISGMIGLQQTRRGVPLHTAVHLQRVRNPGDPEGPITFEPLDPRESGPNAVGILHDFSSRPLPEFKSVINRDGNVRHELSASGLGAAAEITIHLGRVLRACAVVPGAVTGSEITIAKLIDTPTELFIRDVLLHESIWDDRLPEVAVYAHPADSSMEFHDSDRLPLSESVSLLGKGIDAARTPEIPRYADLLEYTFERMGWKPKEFRVFRCRVEYPVLHTRLRVTFRRA